MGGTLVVLDRQVLVAAGALVLFGVVMSLAVHPGWIALSEFVGAGLVFAGAPAPFRALPAPASRTM